MQVSEFLKLPRDVREAAYQRARAKVGEGALRLTVLVRAAEDINAETA